MNKYLVLFFMLLASVAYSSTGAILTSVLSQNATSEDKKAEVLMRADLGANSTSEASTPLVSTLQKVDFFDDSSGVSLFTFDGSVNDLGSTINSTSRDITFVPGKFGQAMFTNLSSNSSVILENVSPDLYNSTNVSFSFWAELSEAASGCAAIITLSINSSFTGARAVFWPGAFDVYQGTDIIFPSSLNYKDTPGWHFYAVSVSPTEINIYIDDQLAATEARSPLNDGGSYYPAYFLGSNPYCIANDYGPSKIRIDQLRIFNRALSDAEIDQLYREQ